MKRAERQHLKENPVAQLVADLREATIGHSQQAAYATLALVLVVAGVAGYFLWQSRRTANADTQLAMAMAVAETPVVPAMPAGTPNQNVPGGATFATEQARLEASLQKFLEVANRYPSTPAGAAALYQAANALSALGRVPEAEQRYQDVIARDGGGIYGQMAQLGLADCYRKAGQLEQAIALYQKLATAADTRLPVDGILIQLGRAYAKAGKSDEAARTYTRLVQEFPQSLYLADAQQALTALKKS